MDLLITVLGNAVAQDQFRETLFRGDPVAAVEAWGFRLTKGENEMLKDIFTGDDAYLEKLNKLFDELGTQVHIRVCAKPCKMSVGPPVCAPSPIEKAA